MRPASRRSAAWSRPRPKQGVGTLTLYAFSSDNWRRPKAEVAALMALLRFYLANEVEALVAQRRAPHRDRPPRPPARRHCRRDRARGSGDRERRRRCICASRSTIPRAMRSSMPRRGRRHRRSDPRDCSPSSSPARRACATSISSSAPAARSGCPTSCSGKAPMPNCTSPSGCGPNSMATSSPRRSASFHRRERRFGGLPSLSLEPAPSL